MSRPYCDYCASYMRCENRNCTEFSPAPDSEALIDTEAIAWALGKLRNFGVLDNTMDNALMADRLEAMLKGAQ